MKRKFIKLIDKKYGHTMLFVNQVQMQMYITSYGLTKEDYEIEEI